MTTMREGSHHQGVDVDADRRPRGEADTGELVEHLRALAEAAQRRLLRYSFDLHDGALQDVIALLMDVRLFRAELGNAGKGVFDRVARRVDEVEARLTDIERELRELAHSLRGSRLGSLGDAIRAETAALGNTTGIEVDLSLDGDLDALTDSQQIALLRILQGALANVRQHSRATRTTVAVAVTQAGSQIQIRDNGRGFDPDATLARVSDRGQLGLYSMRERVRLLSGQFSITSRPGETEVLARLPVWPQPPSEASSAPPARGHARAGEGDAAMS